jgi:DNA-binding winged helix-turn-helix (wHTH) protein
MILYTLRRKIEKNPANPDYIVSEPGLGYRFRNPACWTEFELVEIYPIGVF